MQAIKDEDKRKQMEAEEIIEDEKEYNLPEGEDNYDFIEKEFYKIVYYDVKTKPVNYEKTLMLTTPFDEIGHDRVIDNIKIRENTYSRKNKDSKEPTRHIHKRVYYFEGIIAEFKKICLNNLEHMHSFRVQIDFGYTLEKVVRTGEENISYSYSHHVAVPGMSKKKAESATITSANLKSIDHYIEYIEALIRGFFDHSHDTSRDRKSVV